MSISASLARPWLLVFLLLSAGCEKSSTEQVTPIRPVRVMQIEQAGATARQSLAGVAKASQEMSLSFRVSGTLVKLKVKLGDEVKKGDLIASLDTKDALIEIERSKASVARANAEYRSAQADFERVKSLYADGSGSRSELDAARAQSESARALLSAERKGLEMSRSKLADHQLKAPLPGAIAEVPVEVNENVQSGQAVAVLNAGEKAEVEVAVPERIIEFFHRGTKASISFDSIGKDEFQGVVTEVGVSSPQASGFPVRIALLKADKRIRAGMSALVTLELEDTGSATRIFAPPAAVMEDNQSQRYVLLAEPGEKGFAQVTRRNVTMGEPSPLGVLIEKGLKGGELVIVAGLGQISDGMKVRLLTKDQPKNAKNRLHGVKEASKKKTAPAAPATPAKEKDVVEGKPQ